MAGSASPALPGASPLRALLNPLRNAIDEDTRKALNWVLLWVVLLHAPFVPMWYIGGPGRYGLIVGFAAIALVSRTRSAVFRQVLFLAALIFAVLSEISGVFNLQINSLLHSIGFLVEMNPGSSIEYVAGGLIVVLTAGLGLVIARRPMDFTGNKGMACAAAAIALLGCTDYAISYDLRGHYKQEAPSDARFESGGVNSGWATAANGNHHQLLVMVESLGLPDNSPELRRHLFASFLSPEVRSRYTVSTGTSLFYNSTTAGEIRELCGRWGDYYDLVEKRDDTCLPARLRKRGYDTVAWHSFTGDFFNRDKWYPNIGFDKRVFAHDLVKQGTGECGGVFPGACDRNVPPLIGKALAAAKKPTFFYWLTVNSHLPVPPGVNLENENCARLSPQLARDMPMVCRQLAIWQSIDAALAKMIMADDFPDTDILIVGDHMPPYFDRTMRTQFDSQHVPWIRLTPIGRSASPALAGARKPVERPA